MMALHQATFDAFLSNFVPLLIFGLIIGAVSLMFGESD